METAVEIMRPVMMKPKSVLEKRDKRRARNGSADSAVRNVDGMGTAVEIS